MYTQVQRVKIPGSPGVVALIMAAVLWPAGPAAAIDPSAARYQPDADELFWFVQITDPHVGAGWPYDPQDSENLDWAVGEMFDVILPEFLVITGDLVDATDGWGIPTQQYQSEWDEYRSIIDPYAPDLSWLIDMPGNHDTYSDDGATYYLGNSLLGSTTGVMHYSWVLSFPFGDYLFVGLNSADTDGSWPGLDSPGLTEDELSTFGSALTFGSSASLAFLFTHHPLDVLEFGDGEVESLLSTYRVSTWGNGHDHSSYVELHDATIHVNVDSLGKSSGDNVAVYTVDHDGLAVRLFDADDWPMVLITSPVDDGLGGGNPYAYPVSVHQAANHVRAVVFDMVSPTEVFYTVDGGAEVAMAEVATSVWQADWDCTGLTEGQHEVAVTAHTPSGSGTHSIEVEVATTACDDGVDNDGNAYTDYPDDGGCDSPSDDTEAGWEPGGDDDDDDDDSAGDDDDATDDDDNSAAGDDDSADGTRDDDDSAAVVDIVILEDSPDRVGCLCSATGRGATPGLLALAALLGAVVWRRSIRG